MRQWSHGIPAKRLESEPIPSIDVNRERFVVVPGFFYNPFLCSWCALTVS